MILCKFGIHRWFYPQVKLYPFQDLLFMLDWDLIKHRRCRWCGKRQKKNIYYAFHSKIVEWSDSYDMFWWKDQEN